MRHLINAFKKNSLCTLEIVYLYLVFFFVELQTTIKIPLKIKPRSIQQ